MSIYFFNLKKQEKEEKMICEKVSEEISPEVCKSYKNCFCFMSLTEAGKERPAWITEDVYYRFLVLEQLRQYPLEKRKEVK